MNVIVSSGGDDLVCGVIFAVKTALRQVLQNKKVIVMSLMMILLMTVKMIMPTIMITLITPCEKPACPQLPSSHVHKL